MEGNPAENKPETQHTQPAVVHHYGKRKFNPALTFFIAGIVVLVIVVVLIFALKGHSTPTTEIEKINLSYSIALEDGTPIDSGESVFNTGAVASSLGLKTDKLDAEISSIGDGDEKAIILDAADAYGAYDDSKVYEINKTLAIVDREFDINRTFSVSMDDFKTAFNETPILNKTYEMDQDIFEGYTVIELNDTDAKLSIDVSLGDNLTDPELFPFASLNVKGLTDEKITFFREGEETSVFSDQIGTSIKSTFTDDKVELSIDPKVGEDIVNLEKEGKVVSFDENMVKLDANPELSGKKVIVAVKVISRYKEKSSVTGAAIVPGAPTMQVFIMSHCPYGTQMIKGVLPVMKKFAGKANIEIRFVSYTMHGAQEELDNKRIACIREEQSDKLIDYLECFVSSTGTEDSIQACMVKVDKAKLDSCVESKADTYLEADNALNDEYGVRGSPTIVINGEEADVYPRDPQTVATALCNAFTSNKPSACSETFSTTNPSAGFGTGSSSSGGSCGA